MDDVAHYDGDVAVTSCSAYKAGGDKDGDVSAGSSAN